MPRPSKTIRRQLINAGQEYKKGNRKEAYQLWEKAAVARKEAYKAKHNKKKAAAEAAAAEDAAKQAAASE